MRPKIISCKNISRSLLYNEQKVTNGQAECLLAANFLKEPSRLSFEDKLGRFRRRMELNDKVYTNQHITLNFDPTDELSNEKMRDIARDYMKGIGFEHQPYLVYRHLDAGHPHCHIVTTHVKANGDPIELYKIGEKQSEQTRLDLELRYGLTTKEKKQQMRKAQDLSQTAQKVIYGQKSLARAVSAVVEHVTKHRRFTTFEQYNEILRTYNVEAWCGRENTKLNRDHGLLYRILDENGKYRGVPLKASFFDCKPTLKNINKLCAANITLKIEEEAGLLSQEEQQQEQQRLSPFLERLREREKEELSDEPQQRHRIRHSF